MRALPTKTQTLVPSAVRERHAPFFSSPATPKGFENPWPHDSLPALGGVLRWKTQANPLRPLGYRPQPLELPAHPLAELEALGDAATRVFWIGHASFLFELDGARFVIDPIFGRAGGVVPRVTQAAATPSDLHGIEAVLVTHGHHDHLDARSLKQLALGNSKDPSGGPLFIVPSGLGRSLPRECRNVVELSWWEHVTVSGVKVHLVPAQHWHRRGMFDNNKSLWGGFVLEGSHRVYHSGDTGYFGGFRAIGEAFSGIDIACLPLGAYEPGWFMATQHMGPAQSLQAYRDLSATHFVGMHWGTFDLSDEPVDAGPRWLLAEVEQERLARERCHVLLPGGSLALSGPRDQAVAQSAHIFRPR